MAVTSLTSLTKSNLAPVYVLQGQEDYFVDQYKAKIIDVLKDEIDEELVIYDLQEVPIEHVITDLETLPFFTERKLIFAYHPSFLTTKPAKTTFKHDLTVLEKYLLNPSPFSTLIFVAPYEKFDERKKITKLVKKQSTIINCQPIRENEVRGWVNQLAKEKNVRLSNEVVAFFETEFQTNLLLIENEIEKLAMHVGEGNEVTIDIALDLISTSLTHNALELVDAVLKKDLHKAILIYRDLQIMKEEPIGLIALLAYQFRIIYQVKILMDKGLPNPSIQSQMKVHPYVVKLASGRARRFSYDKLTQIMIEFTQADASIKQGKIEKHIAFELLLYNLTSK